MKSYFVPFVGAFAAIALFFLLLDFTIMKLQGLSLIFHQ